MLNPVIVRGFCILLDPKRRVVEVINYSKGPGSPNLTALSVGISGLPGGTGVQVEQPLNVLIAPEEYMSLHFPVLDQAVNQFRDKNPGVTHFRVRVTVNRVQANIDTTQHATFLGKFEGSTYEIDRYPIESEIG